MPLQVSELLAPIGESSPAGVNLRYEPIYEQIKQARVEEDELPSGAWETERKTADYALVVRLATEALTKRSKDLQIAAWLAEALLKREGFSGFASGLDLMRLLVENFWDGVFPELDEDGDSEFRAAPLEWVGQYMDRAVRLVPIDAAGHTMIQAQEARAVGYEADAKTYEAKDARKKAIDAGRLTAEDFDSSFNATPKAWYKQMLADMDVAVEALDALDLVCQDKFGREAPRFAPLRSAIAELRQEIQPLLARKLEVDPDPVVEEPAEPPPEEEAAVTADSAWAATPGAAGSAAAGAAPVLGAGALPGSRAEAEARIASAARYLRQAAPTDPAAYLLLRGYRWGELRAGDGHLDPHMLVAPPTEVRTRLKNLLLDEKWKDLLQAGEEVMETAGGRGWLDLQRYVITACDALGRSHAHLGAALRSELRTLLRDVPGLQNMTLTDDAPAANPETLAWLRTEGILSSDGTEEIVVAPPRFNQDPLDQAQELVRAKQPQKAIDLLMREAAQTRSARNRFLRRSQAAAIMVDAGLEPVALPILQQLVEQIQAFKLEEWEEGETVAGTLGLLYRCVLKLGGGANAQELYLRVCRLDPMLALQLPAAK